ncbi:MAG: hypothetical protein ACK53E_14220 [Pseudanabaena sp.]|jgi:hypothetical protein
MKSKEISTAMIIDKLQDFRQQAYRFLGNGRDAIFDLMDAVLTSPSVKIICGMIIVSSVSAEIVKLA